MLRAICLLILAVGARAEEAPAAQVLWVKGEVSLVRSGHQAPESVLQGAKLYAGDRLQARPGADAGLLVGGVTRNLASLPEGRWKVGEPFEAQAKGSPPASKPAGVDFAAAGKSREPTPRFHLENGQLRIDTPLAVMGKEPKGETRPLSGNVAPTEVHFKFPRTGGKLVIYLNKSHTVVHQTEVGKCYQWTYEIGRGGSRLSGEFCIAQPPHIDSGLPDLERGRLLEKAGFNDAALECYRRSKAPEAAACMRELLMAHESLQIGRAHV